MRGTHETILSIAIFAVGGFQAGNCSELLVVDAVVDQIYQQLAKRRGLTLIAAPESTGVQLGAIYYVTEPHCEAELYRWGGTEKALQLFAALPPVEITKPVSPYAWTKVRVATLLGAEAGGQISGGATQKSAEITAAFKALTETNAEFSYAVLEAPSLSVRNAVAESLHAHSVTDPRDVSGDAVGLISPHAQLVIQNLIYDHRAVRGRGASAMVRITEAILGALRANKDRRDDFGLRNPTYAVAAIKPLPFLFLCPVQSDNAQ